MAERSNAAVLKTVEGHTSGGSNPSLSANKRACANMLFFVLRTFGGSLLTQEGTKNKIALRSNVFVCKAARGNEGIFNP